jgi:2,4-dienoyl-CoA reductase-like NADH-dependent reductase (Old Yellow Enzyme family)
MLRALTKAVHRNGGKIVMQLSHAGMYADPQLTGLDAKAVSASKHYTPYRLKELTSECIEEIVQAFAAGAQLAEAARFDGVQIHSGHGYLLSQFLSPAYNAQPMAGELATARNLYWRSCGG